MIEKKKLVTLSKKELKGANKYQKEQLSLWTEKPLSIEEMGLLKERMSTDSISTAKLFVMSYDGIKNNISKFGTYENRIQEFLSQFDEDIMVLRKDLEDLEETAYGRHFRKRKIQEIVSINREKILMLIQTFDKLNDGGIDELY